MSFAWLFAIVAFMAFVLTAYLLWHSYKKNRELTEKYCRLQVMVEQYERERQSTGNGQTGLVEHIVAEPSEQEELSADENGQETHMEVRPSKEQELFRQLCELMDSPEQPYTDTELDRTRLARALGTNEHYVSDAVSACTNGGSIIDFINGYRLRHAVRLLTTTNDSIGLIAELSGFSRRSFYRVFDEAYHLSPTEYRKSLRK